MPGKSHNCRRGPDRRTSSNRLDRQMRTRVSLKPGRRGTKKLLAEYGDRLVRVRHRQDERTGQLFKTVELIVEEMTDRPPDKSSTGQRIVRLRVGWDEWEMRTTVKEAGGRWNPRERVWELRYDRVVELGLEERVAEG